MVYVKGDPQLQINDISRPYWRLRTSVLNSYSLKRRRCNFIFSVTTAKQFECHRGFFLTFVNYSESSQDPNPRVWVVGADFAQVTSVNYLE